MEKLTSDELDRLNVILAKLKLSGEDPMGVDAPSPAEMRDFWTLQDKLAPKAPMAPMEPKGIDKLKRPNISPSDVVEILADGTKENVDAFKKDNRDLIEQANELGKPGWHFYDQKWILTK